MITLLTLLYPISILLFLYPRSRVYIQVRTVLREALRFPLQHHSTVSLHFCNLLYSLRVTHALSRTVYYLRYFFNYSTTVQFFFRLFFFFRSCSSLFVTTKPANDNAISTCIWEKNERRAQICNIGILLSQLFQNVWPSDI